MTLPHLIHNNRFPVEHTCSAYRRSKGEIVRETVDVKNLLRNAECKCKFTGETPYYLQGKIVNILEL